MMLSSVILRVDPLVGSDIKVVCRDLVALANRTDCTVEAKFNGVLVWGRPGDDPETLAKIAELEMSLPPGTFRIAAIPRTA